MKAEDFLNQGIGPVKETSSYADMSAESFLDTPEAIEPRGSGYTGEWGEKERGRRTLGGTSADVAISVGKGVVGLGEAAVGLADIPTLGRVGKGMEKCLGYDPATTQEFLGGFYSPAQKAAFEKVEKAKGFVGTTKEMIKHPSTIGHAVVESAPQMLGGAAAARKLIASGLLKMTPAWNNIIAAAMGEGLVSAGATAEGIRQQTKDGVLTLKQAAIPVISGAGTALFAVVGGRVAQKFGIIDPDIFLAGGSNVTSTGIIKRIIGGGITEGAFEELPQSMQEQVWLNAALDKPLLEDVGEAGATGTLTGFAMGAGFNIFTGRPISGPTEDITPTEPTAPTEARAGIDREGMLNNIKADLESGNITADDVVEFARLPEAEGIVDDLKSLVPDLRPVLNDIISEKVKSEINKKMEDADARGVLLGKDKDVTAKELLTGKREEVLTPEARQEIIEAEMPAPTEPKTDVALEPVGVEIPTFKSTQEAYAFGEKATPEQVDELKRLSNIQNVEYEKFKKAGKLQEAMDAAVKGQFYHEALQKVEGTEEYKKFKPIKAVVAKEVEKAEVPEIIKSKLEEKYGRFLEKVGKRLESEAIGQDILDILEEKNIRPANVSKTFWEDTFFKLPSEAQNNITKYLQSITGMKPGDVIATLKGKEIKAKDWIDIAKMLGDDFTSIEYLEGTERGYIALMAYANEQIKIEAAKPLPPKLPKAKPSEAAREDFEGEVIPEPTPKVGKEKVEVTPEKKEPWEMSVKELAEQEGDWYKGKQYQIPRDKFKMIGIERGYVKKDGKLHYVLANGEIGGELEKELYDSKIQSGLKSHRYFVEKAIKEGKTIPPEVLKDYPDLKVEKKVEVTPEKPTGKAKEPAIDVIFAMEDFPKLTKLLPKFKSGEEFSKINEAASRWGKAPSSFSAHETDLMNDLLRNDVDSINFVKLGKMAGKDFKDKFGKDFFEFWQQRQEAEKIVFKPAIKQIASEQLAKPTDVKTPEGKEIPIPKELEPLAKEARKYKTAKKFERVINKAIKQSREGKTQESMIGGLKIGDAEYSYEIGMALDKAGYKNITTFYNEATKKLEKPTGISEKLEVETTSEGKEYFITTREGTTEKVKGRPVSIKGFEKYEFFYSKDEGEFVISEATTGFRIAAELTLKGAKATAEINLDAHKAELDEKIKDAQNILQEFKKADKPFKKPTGIKEPPRVRDEKAFATKEDLSEAFNKRAIGVYGTTKVSKSIGYITRQGVGIDSSGIKLGAASQGRNIDHREIAQDALGDSFEESGSKAMRKFMDETGNIRVLSCLDDVNLDIPIGRGMPSIEQLKKIKQLSKGKGIVYDLTDKNGDIVHSGEVATYAKFLNDLELTIKFEAKLKEAVASGKLSKQLSPLTNFIKKHNLSKKEFLDSRFNRENPLYGEHRKAMDETTVGVTKLWKDFGLRGDEDFYDKAIGEQPFFSTTTKPQDTITRKDLRKIFSRMKHIRTGQDKDGNLWFKATGRPKVTIYELDNITGHLNTSAGQIPVGSYLKDTIELKTGGKGYTADISTAYHEFFHWLSKNRFLSTNDTITLNRTIAKIKGIAEGDVTEEHRAYYVGDNISAWETQKHPRIRRILRKLKDFMRAIYDFAAQAGWVAERERTAEGVLSDIESGRILSEKELAGVNQFAQDVAFSLKKAAKAITDNPNFVKWFRGSKIVDDNDKPLTVYHGTRADFTEFSKAFYGSGVSGESREGFFFSSSPVEAADYVGGIAPGGRILPVYLTMKNPLELEYSEHKIDDIIESDADVAKYLKKMRTFYSRLRGRDGLILKNIDGKKDLSLYVAIEPTQIKSIYNTGAFGLKEKDIRYQMAGTKAIGAPTGQLVKAQEMLKRMEDIRFKLKGWSGVEIVIAKDGAARKYKIINSKGEYLDRFYTKEEAQAKIDSIAKLAREARGLSKKEVWRETGWMKGAEGKYRFEIDDSGAELSKYYSKKDNKYSVAETIYEWMKTLRDPNITADEIKLSAILDHAELYKAYPQLKNITVRLVKGGNEGGSYNEEIKQILINAPDKLPTNNQVKLIFLHEVQHAIQEIEGFAKGSHPSDFKTIKIGDIEKKKALKQRDDLWDKAPKTFQDTARIINQELMYKKSVPDRYNEKRFFDALDKIEAEYSNLYDKYTDLHSKAYYAEQNIEYLGELTPQEQYLKVAGEIEARDTSARAKLTPKQRREQMPYESQGIPEDQWIVTKGEGTSFSVESKRVGLFKQKGSSLDNEGMELLYTVHIDKHYGYDKSGEYKLVVDKIYYDDIGLNLQADTLKGLKTEITKAKSIEETKQFATKPTKDYKAMLKKYQEAHATPAEKAKQAKKSAKDYVKDFTVDYIKVLDRYEAKLKSAETKLEKIKTSKEILKERRGFIKAAGDYFNLTDRELRQISGKDIRLMSNFEFKQFVDMIRVKAEEFDVKRQAANELDLIRREKNFVAENNIRRFHELPTIKKMTKDQLNEYADILSKYEKGDQFLTPKRIKGLETTKWEGAKTMREVLKKASKEFDIPLSDLQKIRVKELDRFRFDTPLARQNAFYNFMVDTIKTAQIKNQFKYFAEREKLYSLGKTALQSKKRGMVGRLIPRQKELMTYMEAEGYAKIKAAEKLTIEEIYLANYIWEFYTKAYNWLLMAQELKTSRFADSKYVFHSKRPLSELLIDIKDTGVKSAAKDLLNRWRLDEAQFKILDSKTGDVLRLKKFFRQTLYRTGELTPTKNVIKATDIYMQQFFNKMALDESVPAIETLAMALRPQEKTKTGLFLNDSLMTFVKEYLNNKKGRTINIGGIQQGGRIDTVIRFVNTIVSLRYIALNIPLEVAAIIGETTAKIPAMGNRKLIRANMRKMTPRGRRILKKYKAYVGEGVFEEVLQPARNIGENINMILYGLFKWSRKVTKQDILLGNMTKAEFMAETISTEKLAEATKMAGRWIDIEGAKSIIGSTSTGATITKFRGWAIPIVSSVIHDIVSLTRTITRLGDPQKRLNKQQFQELYRIAEIGAITTAVLSLGIDDDKDTFAGRLKHYAIRELGTIFNALRTMTIVSGGVTIAFLEKLSQNLHLLITLEKYKTRDEFKGVAALKRQLKPAAISQFQGKEKKKPEKKKVRFTSKFSSSKSKFGRGFE